MILTLQKIIKIYFALLIIGFFVTSTVQAEEALTLSVSPTLFEMTANPTQQWESSVRVINSNPYDIVVSVDVLNFAAEGESGQGKFLPVYTEETAGKTLAEWIKLDLVEVLVPAEKTTEIPFKIIVPDTAPPGGHAAAILVGTKSLTSGNDRALVETSQVVTSLVFLRVTGDVVEDGVIREFRSTALLAEKPEMNFELRFENKGNVHILPQGEIKIVNMWGQERGIIPVNRHTLFGNVLPNSIRKYTFSWSGQWSLSDLGRYRALATLAYGEDSRKFVTSETFFWVLPWKVLLGALLILVAFAYLLTWSIKIYIKRMFKLAGVAQINPTPEQQSEVKSKLRKVSIVAPLEEGILDLTQRFRDSEGWLQKIASTATFVKQQKIFFGVALAVTLFTIAGILYVKNASVAERPYEITIDGVTDDVTISSEQMEYEALLQEVSTSTDQARVEAFPLIKIINQSGVTGLAAELRLELEKAGYVISSLTNELDSSEENTVIVYAPEYVAEALELSGQVYGALTSSYAPASNTDTPIVVYVGKDLENAVQ